MGAYRSTRHPGTARVPERKVRASQNGSHESWGSRTPVRRGDPRSRGRAGLCAGVARCACVGRAVLSPPRLHRSSAPCLRLSVLFAIESQRRSFVDAMR